MRWLVDWLLQFSVSQHFFSLLFRQFHCHKSIASFFFLYFDMSFPQINCHIPPPPSIFAMSLPQFFGCHNFFFLPFSAAWLPQFIFSLSSLPYNFDNLVATIGFPLGSKNFSIISLSKFNFSPSSITSLIFPLSHTFSCNFNINVAEIHSLSSFFQINLNNNYITNKEIFLQYLAKRLICLSYGTKRTLLLKIETCNLHINIIYTEVYLFIYLTLVCLMPSHKETDELIHEIFLWYLRANCRPKNSNLLFFFFWGESNLLNKWWEFEYSPFIIWIWIWSSNINSHILKISIYQNLFMHKIKQSRVIIKKIWVY